MNQEQSFNNISIDSTEGKPSVTAEANAKIQLENCWVQRIVKESNGEVVLTNCFVAGDQAIEIGGNNKVSDSFFDLIL